VSRHARRTSPRALAAVVTAIALAGCAAATGGAVEGGVFRSPKGYRVTLPAGWTVAPDGAADLTLRHEGPRAGMLADATCGGPRRSPALVTRHLAFGVTARRDVVRETLEIGGRPAARMELRGRLEGVDVGVEAFAVQGPRCLYDFLYVAPVEDFEAGRDAFHRFVESLGE
jgi:hypothetical protein